MLAPTFWSLANWPETVARMFGTSVVLAVAVAQPVLVDRIAVVIDGQPLFHSAIVARAKRGVINATAKEDPKQAFLRARAELIEATLIANDGKLLSVTNDEVELALDEVAKSNSITRTQLEAAAREQGLVMREYREMVRDQLFEMRWLMVRASERGVKATDSDRMQVYANLRVTLLEQLRKHAIIEVFE